MPCISQSTDVWTPEHCLTASSVACTGDVARCARGLLVSTEVSRQKPAALALASIAIAIGMPAGRLREPSRFVTQLHPRSRDQPKSFASQHAPPPTRRRHIELVPVCRL